MSSIQLISDAEISNLESDFLETEKSAKILAGIAE